MTNPEIPPFPITDLNAWLAVEQYLWNCTDLWSCYDKILEQIGQVANASRTYIVEIENHTNSTGHQFTSRPFTAPIVEWCATPHTVQKEIAQQEIAQQEIAQRQSLNWQHKLPESVLFAWVATLRQDKIVVQFLPESPFIESSDSPTWQPFAVVLLPLKMQGVLYGAIGLEYELIEPYNEVSNPTKQNLPEQNLLEQNLLERKQPELEPATKQMLRNIARVLACKLEQIQYQTQLNALSQQVQQLQNNLENVVQRHTMQLQKALDFEALLKRITDRVRDSLDERQILQTAVQELATGLGVYSCDAALYDLEQGTSTIAYEYIHCEEIAPARGIVFCLADYPEIYSQLLEGQYLQFCWIIPPDILPRNLKTQLVSLGCPLIDDQGVIGDIWLYSSVDTYFDNEELRLIEQVANQCAIALRQARLYQESQAQVQKLEHLNYLKDDFLNTVSHELRSPMANIEMSIQMLELLLFKESYLSTTESTTDSYAAIDSDGIPEPFNYLAASSETQLDRVIHVPTAAAFQQAWRYFQMLQDECLRETNLINDLLDLSRLEAGTEPIFLTTIHLQAWIPHVVEPFLERARNQQQHLQIEISEDLPPLSTDLSGLERILTELLHNACKYTPAGGKIQVFAWLEPKNGDNLGNQADVHPFASNLLALSALSSNFQLQYSNSASLFPAPKTLLLQISNSGVEIPTAELPRIFDKFYRIPSNDPWKHGGTGLGLALVKRLVEHLGATIDVESSNNRVIFTITLPLSIVISL